MRHTNDLHVPPGDDPTTEILNEALPGIARYTRLDSGRKYVVSCVNGCDAAGATDPSVLPRFMAAIESMERFFEAQPYGVLDRESQTVLELRAALAKLRV